MSLADNNNYSVVMATVDASITDTVEQGDQQQIQQQSDQRDASSSLNSTQLHEELSATKHQLSSLFEDKQLPKKTRRYYKSQNELLSSIDDIQLHLEAYNNNNAQSDSGNSSHKKFLTPSTISKLTFLINFMLLCGKATAAVLSGSLAVISSVLDSAVDLASGAILWWSNRAIKHVDYSLYPRGRRKLEPVAIMILAVIMSLASVQIIITSIEKIASYAMYDTGCHDNFTNETQVICGTEQQLTDMLSPCLSGESGPTVEIPTIIICCVTIGVKLVMYLVCRTINNPSVQALALDHRNDVVSNSSAITFGLIGYHLLKYIDPVGAIIISLYIIINWFMTARDQIRLLTGFTASPEFINMLTWVIINHDPRILYIDDLKAFHFGNNYFVEVDLVLPESMAIRESHDIGETLQIKLERLDEIERVFVHIDYETGYRHHLTQL